MLIAEEYALSQQDKTDEVLTKRRADGFEVIPTASTLLLLDLDDRAALDTFEERKNLVCEVFPFIEEGRWVSKSGDGYHVVLRLKQRLAPAERLLLQVALGSDWKREVLGLQLVHNEVTPFSFLFKPPAPPVEDEEVPF